MSVVEGQPMIALLLQRLAAATRIDEVVLATSVRPENDPLAEAVIRMGFRVHRGSEEDVLSRTIEAASDATSIVRITGDCPFTDPGIVDEVCAAFDSGCVDYASNVDPPTFPDGLDVEVVSTDALRRVAALEHEGRFREHVTLAIRERPGFRRVNIANQRDLSALRWTVDEASDLEVARGVFAHFRPRLDFGWREVLELAERTPRLFGANAGTPRNEGLVMGEADKRLRSGRRPSP
jgi:glutamate-1-semialdehyde 2,1-aminomutase